LASFFLGEGEWVNGGLGRQVKAGDSTIEEEKWSKEFLVTKIK
jgi:hypothetical protein